MRIGKIAATIALACLLAACGHFPKRFPVGLGAELSSMGAPQTPFIRGRLVCAINVKAALAARGISVPQSNYAKAFLTWGRPSPCVAGAVAVYDRGGVRGHAALVSGVDPDGTIRVWNPSARAQAWREGRYHKRPIACRMP